MRRSARLMWALLAGLAVTGGCDDGESEGAGTDAALTEGDAAVAMDARIAPPNPDRGLIVDDLGPLDLSVDQGQAPGCDEAVARIVTCGVTEAGCPAWGPGGTPEAEVASGLAAACAATPALGTLTNSHAGDCASLIEALSDASPDFAAACTGPAAVSPDLSTPLAIEAWLEGKTAVMTGADLPEWPLGYFEGANYGEATQCLAEVRLRFADVTFISDTDFGTLNGAPEEGSVGVCDHQTTSRQAQVVTRGHAIEGDGACFDLRLDFGTYVLEGRGDFGADGRTLRLELFYAGQATGTSCLDGAVGTPGIQVSGMDLGGDAVQVYRVID